MRKLKENKTIFEIIGTDINDPKKEKEETNLSEFIGNSLSYSKKTTVPSKPIHKIFAHKNEVTCLCFSPLGDLIATGGGDSLVKVWDPNSGVEIASLKDFKKSITSVSINLDNSVLAASSVADHLIKTFNIKTQRVMNTLSGHKDNINAIKCCLRSRKIWSGSSDRTIKLWDYDKLKCEMTQMCFSTCYDVDLTVEDSMLVSGHLDGSLKIWSATTGEKVKEINDILKSSNSSIVSVEFSKDGTLILVNSSDSILRVVDIRTFEILNELKSEHYSNTSSYNRACFSPDNNYCVVGSNSKVVIFSREKSDVFDIYSDVHKSRVLSTKWKPRESCFATIDQLGGLIIWN